MVFTHHEWSITMSDVGVQEVDEIRERTSGTSQVPSFEAWPTRSTVHLGPN
jgi:hypothetical protein